MGIKIKLPIGSMMGDVLRAFVQKPITQRYPFERLEAPEAFRGKLMWDLSHCTGCQLCIKDCPANAIELLVVDKVKKHFVMRFHSDRCTYCGQCVYNCRFNCLSLSSKEWELAELTKKPFTIYYGRDGDVNAMMAESGSQVDEE